MIRHLSKPTGWRRWLPYRLSSQLLAFVGVTAAIAATLVGGVFTHDSVEHSRDQVNDEIAFLGKNIAAMSGMLIINKDIPFLEDVLSLNAQFPMVDSVLVVDDHGKVLAEVIKRKGEIEVATTDRSETPREYDQSIDVATGKIASPSMIESLLPKENTLEMWHPVKAGRLLGSIRIRYSLKELRHTILQQWERTFVYIGLTVLGVFILLGLMLRTPMKALHDTTVFASKLGTKMGSRIPIYHGTKEFAELTQALNGLSEQLKYQDKALADRIAQNQSILDNVVDGILTIDAIGTIRSFNQAASQIFGYTLEEVLGRNVRILMPEPMSGMHDEYMQKYNETGIAKVVGMSRETEALRKDGTVFPIDLAISRTTDHDEVIFIGIIRDITERRRLDRLKSEFVSTVSHELRTPLTSIHGSLKLLEGGVAGALPPAAVQLISVAQKSSQRLILLINDLLDMEKLAAGKMSLNLAQHNLIDIVKQSLQDNFGYGSTLGISYVLNEHPPQAIINTDAGRLAQVLANLLSNAAKFSGQSKQVDIRILIENDQAKVEVEDHGDGIPLDFQSEIFGAFAQANNGNTRKQGGTGLGLKISKGLINAMGGEIGFRTNIGVGTVFWFSLPLVAKQADE